MKTRDHLSMLAVVVALVMLSVPPARARERALRVVTTLTDYAWAARAIGGDRVQVRAISQGDQDAHFVRPKPSFAVWMAEADLFITTGLDLELWVPSLLDKAGNARIREGQVGYVAAAAGLALDELPAVMDRSQGGVHIYGNPHIHTSPVNMRQVARNITVGLKKVDPGNAAIYDANLRALVQALDERLFGPELVRLLGGDTLAKLAASGKLWSFLEGRAYKGQPMSALAGGWLARARPLRGRTIVTYHKNWGYFARLFGIQVIGQIEPKPAIPPSPRDVERLIRAMRDQRVTVVLAANYFDEDKVRMITGAVGGHPVIVPLHTRGGPGLDDYPALVDHWIERLLEATPRGD